MKQEEWTLTEVAKLLQQPQHRLIYLCEKQVILPDKADAEGRGTSRRFFTRNMHEFSIALTISEFHFPVAMSGNLLYVLRSFERTVRKTYMVSYTIYVQYELSLKEVGKFNRQ